MSTDSALKLLTLLNVSAVSPANKRRKAAALALANAAEPPKPKRRKSVVWGEQLESGPSGSGLLTPQTSEGARKKAKKSVGLGGDAPVVFEEGSAFEAEVDSDDEESANKGGSMVVALYLSCPLWVEGGQSKRPTERSA